MTTHWIRERKRESEETRTHSSFRSCDDFLRLAPQLNARAPQLLAAVAAAIGPVEDSAGVEALRTLAEQLEQSFDADMVLTMACAMLLGQSPKLETWRMVRQVARHSWPVEHWLGVAMSAHKRVSAVAGQAYVTLAVLLFEALENGELEAASELRNQDRENAREHWRANRSLEEIWWGLRGSDFMNFEEEMRVFGVLSEIDSAVFQRLLGNSQDPFLVDAALLSAGVGAFTPQFSVWEACANAAPDAFAKDGSWNGSVLMPLLLLRARDELLEPGRQLPRIGASEAEVASITSEVEALVQAVVDVLAQRADAPGMFARWSTWLMRQQLRQRNQDPVDIRSSDYVDKALVVRLGRAVLDRGLVPAPPADAAPWEAWCYQCVLSMLADENIGEPPPFEAFADQWQLTPEDWHQQKGRDLLARASTRLPSDEIPGLFANLLVFPLASRAGFAAGWLRLWNSAHYLRVVLEFGSFDAVENDYSDRSDASHLLLLLGCMGLACFDQAASRLGKDDQVEAGELVSMHRILTSAAMEISQLDDTLHRDRWQTILQHLALRRIYGDERVAGTSRLAVFAPGDETLIQSYMQYFQADPGDLITFLHACMSNRFDVAMLRDELQDAAIDLRACVTSLQRLHELNERRYPLRADALQAIAPLMPAVPRPGQPVSAIMPASQGTT
jgi:hypothetical protein